jgi:hypothetical protein
MKCHGAERGERGKQKRTAEKIRSHGKLESKGNKNTEGGQSARTWAGAHAK